MQTSSFISLLLQDNSSRFTHLLKINTLHTQHYVLVVLSNYNTKFTASVTETKHFCLYLKISEKRDERPSKTNAIKLNQLSNLLMSHHEKHLAHNVTHNSH